MQLVFLVAAPVVFDELCLCYVATEFNVWLGGWSRGCFEASTPILFTLLCTVDKNRVEMLLLRDVFKDKEDLRFLSTSKIKRELL